MAFTLVPIVDVGPSLYLPGRQRREPLGMREAGGGHSLHLGDDWAILWTPTDVTIVDSRIRKLADAADETLTNQVRTRLADLRGDGRAIPTRFGDAAADLLIAPPAGRWRQLIATRAGLLLVRLGPGLDNILWSQLVMRGGADVADDFNRTGNLDGSTTSDAQTTWVEDQGTGLTVDGDEVAISGNVGFCVGRIAMAMATADHYSEADLSRLTFGGSGQVFMGVFLRANATPTSGYAFEVGDTTEGNIRRIYNFVTDATIASDATETLTGLLRIQFDGSDYICKIGAATIFSGTNTAFDGTVKGVGLTGFSSVAGNSGAFTSWRGADLGDPDPLFIAGTTKATTGSPGRTGDGALSIAYPTSYTPVAGDLAMIGLYNDQGDGSTPADWIELTGSPFGTATPKLQIFYKVLAGSDATPSSTISGSGTNISHCAGMSIHRNVDPTNPIDAIGAGNQGTGTPMTAPSVTSVTANALALHWCGRGDNEVSGSQTFGGSATGVTEQLDGGTGEGADSQVSMAEKLLGAASSATGQASATTSATDPWVSVIVLLRKKVTGPATLEATLAATDAQDVVAVNVTNRSARLAATDAPDVAAMTAQDTMPATLAATDAPDVVAITAQDILPASLAATDAIDVVAITTNIVKEAQLAATEAQDVVAITATDARVASLAAVEAADVVAITAQDTMPATLAATDTADVVSVTVQIEGGTPENEATLAAVDAPDVVAVVAQDTMPASLAASDTADVVAFVAQDTMPLSLAAVDAPDVAAVVAEVTRPVTLAAVEASDVVEMVAQLLRSISLAAVDAQDVVAVVVENQTTGPTPDLFRAGRVPIRYASAAAGVVPVRLEAAGAGVVPVIVTTETVAGVVPCVITPEASGVVPIVEEP